MADSAIVSCRNRGEKNRVAVVAGGVPRCTACHAALPWIVDADPEPQLRQWPEPHLSPHSAPSN